MCFEHIGPVEIIVNPRSINVWRPVGLMPKKASSFRVDWEWGDFDISNFKGFSAWGKLQNIVFTVYLSLIPSNWLFILAIHFHRTLISWWKTAQVDLLKTIFWSLPQAKNPLKSYLHTFQSSGNVETKEFLHRSPVAQEIKPFVRKVSGKHMTISQISFLEL